MEPSENQNDQAQTPTVTLYPADGRDLETVAPTTTPPVVLASRHLFTLTVDQVSAELSTYGLYRDERTIQRWCKARKVRAIIDQDHGDRYLVDPASVRDMVTTLLAERDDKAHRAPTSRSHHDIVAPPQNYRDGTAPTSRFTERPEHDRPFHVAPDAPAPEVTSSQSRDEVASLKQRIEELEKEKTMLTIDKQVREQMVDYIKGQFGQMLDTALERSQEVGQLRAEVGFLKAQLPSGREGQGGQHGEDFRFTPRHVYDRQDPPMHSPSSKHES